MSRERMELSEMANALFTQIMRQREKILEAFVAETCLHPSECVQVTQGNRWFVMKQTDLDALEELGGMRTKRGKIMRYLGLSDHEEHIAWRAGEDWADAACRGIEERDTMLTAMRGIAEQPCVCGTVTYFEQETFVKCDPCIAKEALPKTP